MTKGSFEAKKHGFRQTQDGVVVSFVIHPNDMPAALAIAPLGTIYMIGFAEVEPKGDASTREDEEVATGEVVSRTGRSATSSPASKPKERKKWREMPPSQRAALLTKDPDFWVYMEKAGPSETVADQHEASRDLCTMLNITSKSQIVPTSREAQLFEMIEGNYFAWQQARQLGAA